LTSYLKKDVNKMQKIKIMLASRPKMISDVIRSLIEHQPDMTMIGEVIDPIRLLYAIKVTPVDVVIITPLKGNGEPKLCSHLLAQYPQLKILTLSAEGGIAYLYQSGTAKLIINEPTEKLIMETIRKSLGKIIG
jgi:DNA-binding NarL/FixJ family response regulator